MTTAIFEQKGSCFEVTINGHADFNPGGPDIVCAACSTLAYTLLQSALSLEADGAFRELHSDVDNGGFHMGGQDGCFYLGLQCADWARERAETMMSVIIAGFALLQQEYPNNVQLCVRSGEK